MRLPSLRVLLEGARDSLARFPLPIAAAFVGTASAVALVDPAVLTESTRNTLTSLLLSAALGLPLFLALALASESASLKGALRWGPSVAGGAVVIVYYLTLPPNPPTAPFAFFIRFWVLNIAFHLLVAVAPYFRKYDVDLFWDFNKTLFLRLLTAVLYTGVLYAGLALALLAVDKLFVLDIDGARYGQLFFILAGLFNTWLFLSGIPREVRLPEAGREYPKGLRVFAQYVLIPLVTIYLLILYAYAAKILAEWDWPKGWVSNLILGFSITGIFTSLLVYPIRQLTEFPVIRFFSRHYYQALLPLVVLLGLAIWRRGSDYGITELRYFVICLALWLAGIVAYFLISKVKSPRAIPVSLCILALLTAVGPWGALAVSERSQKGRLESYLVKNGILADGKVRRAVAAVPLEDARQISSILRYLTTAHGTKTLQPWFDANLDSLSASAGRPETPNASKQIAALLGVWYIEEWESTELMFNDFTAGERGVVPISGYDFMIRLGAIERIDSTVLVKAGDETYRVGFDRSTRVMSVMRQSPKPDTIVFDFNSLGNQLSRGRRDTGKELSARQLVLDGEGREVRIRIAFRSFNCRTVRDTLRFEFGQADLFIRTPHTIINQ